MIYMFFFLITLLICQIFIRKILNNQKIIVSSYLICALLVIYFALLYCTCIYFAKENLYPYSLTQILNIPKPMWQKMIFYDISQISLIRLTNFLSILYVSLCLCFSLNYQNYRPSCKTIKSFVLLQTIHYLMFDPVIYKRIYYLVYPEFLSYQTIMKIQSIVHVLSVAFNCFILLYSLISLARYFFKTPSFREVFRATSMIALIFPFLIILYLAIYWWAPANLIHVNKYANTVRFKPIPRNETLVTYSTVAALETICLLAIFICIIFHGIILKKIADRKKELARKVNNTSVISSTFSHYMKNEMLEIMSEIDLLEESGLNNLQEISITLSRIRQNCTTISERLQILNNNSKLSTIHLISVDLEELVNAALKKRSTKMKSISVIKKIAVRQIMVDRFYFSEVLDNILANSIEAFEGVRQLDRRIQITANESEEWILITISDNGPGIPDKELKNVFEPYSSTKPLKTNWGLGLFVCKRIITAHDGDIKIQSHVNEGTQVSIVLPSVNTPLKEKR